MIKTMSRYALLSAFALFLAGCVTRTEEPAPVDQAKPGTEQPTTPAQPVPTVPSVPTIPAQLARSNIRTTPHSLRRECATMTGTAQCSRWWAKCCRHRALRGSVLLVDSVNNRTNGSLNAGEATETLRNALANNGKFTLVSAQQLAVAKQQLGLSPQDSPGSRSKAIGIARNVGAQYVLYSNATGNVNTPSLQMQLMLVQTGEIIWSGKGAVTQQ